MNFGFQAIPIYYDDDDDASVNTYFDWMNFLDIDECSFLRD